MRELTYPNDSITILNFVGYLMHIKSIIVDTNSSLQNCPQCAESEVYFVFRYILIISKNVSNKRRKS